MNGKTVTLKCHAPAKINLSLKLVGKRIDNYHLLDSVFVPVAELFDEISIILTEGESSVKMSSNHAEMTDADTNLCSKAAKAYFKLTDISVSCQIHLVKNIPIGAGLGGGSSDAAAVLKLLNSHYGKLSSEQLAALALTLGADVPFFLINKISRVGGIGEIITPFENHAEMNFLILSPPFSVSTPWAFKHLNPSVIGENPSKSSSKIAEALKNDDILTAADSLVNDFESLLFEKFPAYQIWRNFLLNTGALHVGLSGSGSSFFALFDSAEKLADAESKFIVKFGTAVKTNKGYINERKCHAYR